MIDQIETAGPAMTGDDNLRVGVRRFDLLERDGIGGQVAVIGVPEIPGI